MPRSLWIKHWLHPCPMRPLKKPLRTKNLAAAGLSSFPLGKLPGRWQRRRLLFWGTAFPAALSLPNTSTPKGRCRPLKSTKQGTLSSMPIPLPRQPVPLIWSRILARMIPFFFLSAVVALPFLKSLLFRFRNCRKSIPIFYRAAPTSFP